MLSVDVEDYFQVEAFADRVDRAQWSTFPSRVETNTHRILDLFDECGVKGTFFVLGWVAQRFPDLVREIVRRGHEPACHSWWHRLVFTLTREDTRAMKPSPEGLIEAVSIVSLPPEDVYYVGDSPLDVVAAKAAGVKMVSVTTGNYSAERLRSEGADYVIASLSQLVPVLGVQQK